VYRHRRRRNKTYGEAMKINPHCKITPKENRQLGRKKNINMTVKRKKVSEKKRV